MSKKSVKITHPEENIVEYRDKITLSGSVNQTVNQSASIGFKGALIYICPRLSGTVLDYGYFVLASRNK